MKEIKIKERQPLCCPARLARYVSVLTKIAPFFNENVTLIPSLTKNTTKFWLSLTALSSVLSEVNNRF